MMAKKFKMKFGDYISQEKKRDLNELDKLLKELEEAQTEQERIEAEDKIKKELISNSIEKKTDEDHSKPPQINEIEISTTEEVQHIALPGYEFIRGESLKQEDTEANSINRPTIDKQLAIQNVLINYFEINPQEIVVISESLRQSHLREKYHAYYTKIKETGILIVLNNQYGQAARIKNIETLENAQTQLALLIAMLENSDKRTMDEIQGFEAFNNIYTTQEELERLYIEKINEYIESANQSNERIEDEFPDNASQEGKLIETETNNEINETLIANQENIELSGSAEDIWKRIQGQTIKSKKGNKQINTIQDFLELPISFIKRGKIGNTLVRNILNTMLGLEGGEKITSHMANEKGRENKLKVENARILLKEKIIEGGLGEKAQEEYEIYINTSSAEDIWSEIQGLSIQSNNQYDIKITTINDLLELSPRRIIHGKIESRPVREIINTLLGLEEGEKITSHSSNKEGKANKSRINRAIKILKEKVLAGELGEEAQEEYKKQLEEKIDLNGSPEDIWSEIQGQTIKIIGSTNKQINTIQDFLKLTFTEITRGRIGNTQVRNIINAILQLEIDKINSRSTKDECANKINMLNNLVIEGDLGEEAQREMQTVIEAQNIQTQIREEIEEI